MYSPKGGTHNKLYTPLTLHCDRIYGFILTQHLYTADANTLHTQMHHAQVDYGRPGNYQNNNGKHKMLVFQHFCIRLQKVIFIPYWGGGRGNKTQNNKTKSSAMLIRSHAHSASVTKHKTICSAMLTRG